MPIYYTDSTEKCEFNKEHDIKYVALVELGSDVKVTPLKIRTRNMITVVDQDYKDLSGSKITENIPRQIGNGKDNVTDAIVKMKLENIDIDESKFIGWNKIKELLGKCDVFDFGFQPRTTLSLPELDNLAGDFTLPPSEELELHVKRKGLLHREIRLGSH